MNLELFPRHDRIERRFLAFHEQNPDIYVKLLALIRQFRRMSGKRRWSIDAAFHVLRWEVLKENRGDQGFKINNDFTALYARKIMDENPDLKDVFEIRVRTAEGGG